jgi:hypothetical protein
LQRGEITSRTAYSGCQKFFRSLRSPLILEPPEPAASRSYQKKKTPSGEKFLGLFCRLGRSDLGVSKRCNPYRFRVSLPFRGISGGDRGKYPHTYPHTFRISLNQDECFGQRKKRRALFIRPFRKVSDGDLKLVEAAGVEPASANSPWKLLHA